MCSELGTVLVMNELHFGQSELHFGQSVLHFDRVYGIALNLKILASFRNYIRRFIDSLIPSITCANFAGLEPWNITGPIGSSKAISLGWKELFKLLLIGKRN